MKSILKWVCAVVAVAFLAAPALAADAIAAGKVKSIDAVKKDFVLTDPAGKDHTFKLGDKVVVNRGGKDTKSDLIAGDAVNVCYDKGVLTSTAHYILVQEGDTKSCTLAHGTFKGYDADKKQFSITDAGGKDAAFPMAGVKVRLNEKDSKAEELRIGDKLLIIVETIGDKATTKCIMVDRK